MSSVKQPHRYVIRIKWTNKHKTHNRIAKFKLILYIYQLVFSWTCSLFSVFIIIIGDENDNGDYAECWWI